MKVAHIGFSGSFKVSSIDQLCPDKIMIKTSQKLFKKVKLTKK